MAARHQPEEEPNELLDRIVGGALRGVMLEYEEEITQFTNGVNRLLGKPRKTARRLPVPKTEHRKPSAGNPPSDTIVRVERV